MRTLSLFAALLTLSVGTSCKKEKAPESPEGSPFDRKDTAPLWKMVPSDAMAAVVVSDGALAHLHNGYIRFIKDFGQAPGGAKVLAEMKQEAELLDKASKPGSEKLIGADLSMGAAFYVTPSEFLVMVLPITDRDAFMKIAEGQKDGDFDSFDSGDTFCQPSGKYYVCADDKAAIATVGGGGGLKPPTQNDLKGHIEVFVSAKAAADLQPPSGPVSALKEIRGQITLEPGGFTVRFLADADVAGEFHTKGAPALLKDVAGKSPTGLLSVRLGGLMKMLMGEIPAEVRNDAGPFGLTPGDMLDAFTGDVAGFALPGELGGELRVGIKSKEPFEKLLPLCSQIPPMLGKGTLENGRCSFEITPPGGFPIKGTVWLDDSALHVGLGDFDGKRKGATALKRMGKDIIDGPWAMASWGYGNFAPHMRAMAQVPEVAKELAEPEAQMALWSILHLSEFGIAFGADDKGIHGLYRVRTTWSNPTAVVDALEPLFVRIASSDFAAIDDVLALAKKHPKSPLSFDVNAGAGIAAPVGLIGMMAAVSVPAFMKYIKKSKTTEARMFVKKLHDGARAYAMDQGGAFPAKSTAVTPPLGACCASGEKCAPDASLWTDPTWVALQFSVDDPHYYSYQYEVAPDGKTFTVRALGDLDCDGTYSTFEMYGQMTADGPTADRGMFKSQETE